MPEGDGADFYRAAVPQQQELARALSGRAGGRLTSARALA